MNNQPTAFNFDLLTTAIIRPVYWWRWPVFKFAKTLKKLFLVSAGVSFLLFAYGFIFENFSLELNRRLFGIFLVLFLLNIIFRLIDTFFWLKLANPKLKLDIREAISRPGEINLAEFLSLESARSVWGTMRWLKSKNTSPGSTALLYFILKENPKLDFIFNRVLLNRKEIMRAIREKVDAAPVGGRAETFLSNFKNAILESLRIASEKGHNRIEVGDLLLGVTTYDLVFKEIMIETKLKVQDIEYLVRWLEILEEKAEESRKFWERKNLIKIGTLAKEWTAGYTINLDRFSVDLSEMERNQGYPETIGHKEAIEEVERILARETGNKALIVGEPGSGRKSIVWALARKSALGESLAPVNYKRVVRLDIPTLLAQTANLDEAEALLDKIFREAVDAGNVILFIDEFHNFVAGIERLGMMDISGILSSYLGLPQFQFVAITSYEGLHKNIEQNPSILNLLEKVEVTEISQRETLILLENLSLVLERKYKKFVTFPALRNIISYCDKYIPAIAFPEKAIDLLEETMVYISQTKESALLPEHVAKIVFEKTQIPVGEIEAKEREILLNLEDLLHQRIINQEEAVKNIASALRRARAEVTLRKGPMGTFLFLGPTGVGKTETSKALAEQYFGSEERMIRLDMSEFQNIPDIGRLIGSVGQEGLLTTSVRETPFSLILLDEIEKAHPNILNLFLQVLDEGHLTDGMGRKVDFKNTIIIATSNAGYQIILEAIKREESWPGVKEKLLDYLFANAIFRPEFINRFDAVVVFKPLSKENLLDIAELLLIKIKKNLAGKDIEFVISLPLKEKIVALGYNPIFGAREMNRVIQDKVENALATAILSGKLKRGNRAEVLPETFEVKIN